MKSVYVCIIFNQAFHQKHGWKKNLKAAPGSWPSLSLTDHGCVFVKRKQFSSSNEILVTGFSESQVNNKDACVTLMLHFLITLKFRNINTANRNLALLAL